MAALKRSPVLHYDYRINPLKSPGALRFTKVGGVFFRASSVVNQQLSNTCTSKNNIKINGYIYRGSNSTILPPFSVGVNS